MQSFAIETKNIAITDAHQLYADFKDACIDYYTTGKLGTSSALPEGTDNVCALMANEITNNAFDAGTISPKDANMFSGITRESCIRLAQNLKTGFGLG